MYRLNDDHSFEIDNFQDKSPFSSFLPGIAGKEGIPIWAFYVNRGQGIASFGIQDKDHAMMEFFPADKSYQMVYMSGFRTFVKVADAEGTRFTEPFSMHDEEKSGITEKMTISENVLTLYHENEVEGFRMEVDYFILPEAPVGALVRHVKIKNTSGERKTFEILDGMPAVLPSGVANAPYKELGNTLKSWFDVANLDVGIPFYTLRGSMEDTAEVKEIHEGNFLWSSVNAGGSKKVVKPIVDRDVIFGTDTSLMKPRNFISSSLEDLKTREEQISNKVSCGFTPLKEDVDKEEEVEILTVAGYAENLELLQTYAKETLNWEYVTERKKMAHSITDELTSPATSKTGQPVFDAYSRQSYLDNGLRGGFPQVFGTEDKKKVYYLYSRKHGDLERDYNFFSISPTFYSQGNGNYRDINQNRRCDVFFNPDVYDSNVKQFMNLIQLDGYNPLAVKGIRFKLHDSAGLHLSSWIGTEAENAVKEFLQDSFTPGELYHFLNENSIDVRGNFEELLSAILPEAEELYEADFAEGYWVDHWTYNLDLINSFLSVYPDKKQDLFFTKSYGFFNSPAYVVPRKDKYVKIDGKLRQYGAVEESDGEQEASWVRTDYGKGNIYKTDLYSKLLLLGAVKTSTLAPWGLGIEMEAGKPGWNDSLNGLPGMLGASTSELMELYRLLELLEETEGSVSLPEEAAAFINGLSRLISTDSEADELAYWDKAAQLREEYRASVRGGISGKEESISAERVKEALSLFKSKVSAGMERVKEHGSLTPTYFYFEGKNEAEEPGQLKLEPFAVTPFLEGVVKSLKVAGSREQAKQIYDNVKASSIYDSKLKMYKTSMSIKEESSELGRANAFTPGWLENESVFLHMEYKYLLEVLRAGLADEFYEDIRHALIPFLDPAVYGRSTLENSSFIASSANPDATLHGKGFVSRLSGSTVEFMNMWIVMMAGERPFTAENGELVFSLKPVLADWMFTENNEVSFTLLGQCNVIYKNPAGRHTFGPDGVKPGSYRLIYNDGRVSEVQGAKVSGRQAEEIRNGLIKEIIVNLK